MPPKKLAVKKSPANEAYKELGELLEKNVDKISEIEPMILNDLFKRVADKEVGMTVGKIVIYEVNGKYFLLKKSGRNREIDGYDKKLSRNMSPQELEKSIKESFNEKCAATLFEILKGEENYLAKTFLVRSDFNMEKAHNILKKDTGVYKVYIASEIIGDHEKVNLETSGIDNIRLIDPDILNQKSVKTPKTPRDNLKEAVPTENNPELIRRALLKKDLCENAVIMILLSNYDLKLDNFVHYEDRMIPIDFGNARYEEKFSPDVIDGIDLIRKTSSKNGSDKFASSKLKTRLSRGTDHTGTQSIYRRNLAPEHFLAVIAKIKQNQSAIEEQLWHNAYIYTFGSKEEKIAYADLIIARVRNLLALEPIFENLQNSENPMRSFTQKSLREIIANNEEFIYKIENSDQENSSVSKDFFRFVTNLFASIQNQESNILGLLEKYIGSQASEKTEKEKEIIEAVDNFNNFLVEQYEEVQKQFFILESTYKSSEYISGSNKIVGDIDSLEKDKDEILEKIMMIFETLNYPLIDKEELTMSFDDSDNSQSAGKPVYSFSSTETSQTNDISNVSDKKIESSLDQSREETSKAIPDQESTSTPEEELNEKILKLEKCQVKWDLSKSEKYKSKLDDMITGYLEEEYKVIRSKMLYLATHLMAHETLMQVRAENENKKSSPSSHPSTTESEQLKPNQSELKIAT
ncbi:MAG: hypothetical protein SFV53_04100 [Rickettsiales bacterium]|nr:hypothetical protein [Rickettsiales bacterium]